MKIKKIDQAGDLAGKKVFLRTDLNVPLERSRVKDDYKIVRQMPTLNFLLQNRAKVVLASHLGRPDPLLREKRYSMAPVAAYLKKLLGGRNVVMARDVIGYDAQTRLALLKEGQVLLLENLRYEKGEKENSRALARTLAKGMDLYVNNAFAVSHRAHASVAAIKDYLPAWAGFLLAAEIEHLEKALHPRPPLIAVIGGAKLATKAPLLKRLEPKAEKILLGGSLANVFLKARGWETGQSLLDPDSLKLARKFTSPKILLPIDAVTSAKADGWRPRVKSLAQISREDYIFDIGPETVRFYARHIKSAATLVWNGPLGMFEDKHYRHGTLAIAQLIAARSTGRAFGVAGGGETVEALKATKMMDNLDWVSTGGGAMLAYLGGAKMPGLKGIVR